MHRHVENAARVRKKRNDVEDRDAHGPEAMRQKREARRRCRPEQVYRQMAGIERCKLRRDERMKQRVGADHRQRDRGHHPFGTATAPGGITGSNQQESEK